MPGSITQHLNDAVNFVGLSVPLSANISFTASPSSCVHSMLGAKMWTEPHIEQTTVKSSTQICCTKASKTKTNINQPPSVLDYDVPILISFSHQICCLTTLGSIGRLRPRP